MPTEVWISTSDHPDMSTLGPEWLHAGHLDSSRETELWKVVQAHLGLRNTPARPTVEFYVDLIVGSDGHHGLLNVLPEGRRDLNGSRMRMSSRCAGAVHQNAPSSPPTRPSSPRCVAGLLNRIPDCVRLRSRSDSG